MAIRGGGLDARHLANMPRIASRQNSAARVLQILDRGVASEQGDSVAQIALRTNPGTCDLDIPLIPSREGYGYELDDGLQTFEMILLYTDKRGVDPADGVEKGGWWADPTWGNTLWLIRGQPISQTLAADVRESIEDGLVPTIRVGMNSEVLVETVLFVEYIEVTITHIRADPQKEPYVSKWAHTESNLIRFP